ncbi:MAG: zinc-dependent metalloprotease [Actinomycetales bacterium]
MTRSAVDWNLAQSVGVRLAPKGPVLDRTSTFATVAMLRELAAEAVDLVAEVTELQVPTGPAAVVVDRSRWIKANVAGLRDAVGPLLTQSAILPAVGSGAVAVQMGAALAWLSTRVLGQFEVFGQQPGQLLLIAPTIVNVERQLGVPPRDFRLWVCLHEEAHRLQFAAAPWLTQVLLDQLRIFLEAADEDALTMVRRITSSVRTQDGSWMERIQAPAQRQAFASMTAVMSLLEGHADVVMDAVGPAVIENLPVIRQRFEARRDHAVGLNAIIRRVLGMDLKLRQYREGAAFVRQVQSQVGVHGFNAVWADSSNLPSAAEISDPAAWVRRVHPAVV